MREGVARLFAAAWSAYPPSLSWPECHQPGPFSVSFSSSHHQLFSFFPSSVHSPTCYSFSSSPCLVHTRRKEERCMLSRFSHVWLFATLWTIAHQGPLSMRFSRQEYWSGLLCPPPGDLPDPGNQTHISYSPALAGGFFTTSTTWEAPKRDQTLKRKRNEIRLAPSPGHAWILLLPQSATGEKRFSSQHLSFSQRRAGERTPTRGAHGKVGLLTVGTFSWNVSRSRAGPVSPGCPSAQSSACICFVCSK